MSAPSFVRHTSRPARESLPARGVVVSVPLLHASLTPGEMSRRSSSSHRMMLPRARAFTRRSRGASAAATKRAYKHAAMRDCGRRCVYCAAPLGFELATLDHVHPLARGGAHAPGNLVAACARCNMLKGDMLPADFFVRFPWAGANFIRYARAVHRALKRSARRAVSLAMAQPLAA